MSGLPKTLVEVDSTLKERARFALLAGDDKLKKQLAEKDYKALLRQHTDILAQLLREAGVLEEDSSLKFLQHEAKQIDLLFAEVAPNEDFRRLVIGEGKLLRSPDSKRTVLGQIIDYAHRVQHELTADELLDGVQHEKEWVRKHLPDIRTRLRSGTCLLLIFGDIIHERLTALVSGFATQASPLSKWEVALVSMNLFSDGKRHFFLPSVVGKVVGAQRDLTIRVSVTGAGAMINSEQMLVEDESQVAGGMSPDEFFNERWAKWPHEREACRRVLNILRKADVDGLRVEHQKNGRPLVTLDTEQWGKVKALRVMHARPAIRDSLDANGVLKRDPKFVKLWNEFRAVLKGVKGAQPKTVHVQLPVPELERDGVNGLVKALHHFSGLLKK